MRRIRRGFTILHEQSYVSYANIATAGGFCYIDLMVIKATTPDDFPLQDKYVHQLLKIFSISPSSIRSFTISFTRRFGRTHSWRVALKCLILLHRLLRSVPESDPVRSELVWARSNGLLSLNPCRFCDDSSANYKHYTLFIRSYAHLVDEALDCYGFDASDAATSLELTHLLHDKMNDLNRLIETLPTLMSLIDRVMDCRPTETISKAFMIQSAMKHIIRDSFVCYKIFKTEISSVLDSMFQMPYRSCIAAFNIYKSAATQASQLSEFYTWCKLKGLCGAYEYPFIETIPKIHVQALETFLGGMWQLTETESSSAASSSPSNTTEYEEGEERVFGLKVGIVVGSDRWEKFEEEEEDDINQLPPLIELEDHNSIIVTKTNNNNNNVISWETLLEASVKNILQRSTTPFWPNYGLLYSAKEIDESKGREMQVYNHFHHHHQEQLQQQPTYDMEMSCVRVYPPSNPAYPWGL
ncbi:unnamed protein product [Rhodiola kirilowii]